MTERLFFSKNKKTAQERLNRLAREDPYFKGMKASYAKKQIPHISGYRTFTYKRIKKSRDPVLEMLGP